MRTRIFIILTFLLAATGSACAQRSHTYGTKSVYTKERFNHNVTRIRGDKARIVCPVSSHTKYPIQGLGFKLGDPFSITYKFYATKKLAVVIDAGKPASSLYNRYFREKFDTYIVTDTFSTAEASITPITHRVKSDIVMEAKLLYHVDVTKISQGLQLYVGGGWEWKRTRLKYDYTYSSGDFQQIDVFGSFERDRITMGPQLVMGIEYAYFNIPISAFMELEYFADVMADPGWRRLEGGVGLRYIF